MSGGSRDVRHAVHSSGLAAAAPGVAVTVQIVAFIHMAVAVVVAAIAEFCFRIAALADPGTQVARAWRKDRARRCAPHSARVGSRDRRARCSRAARRDQARRREAWCGGGTRFAGYPNHGPSARNGAVMRMGAAHRVALLEQLCPLRAPRRTQPRDITSELTAHVVGAALAQHRLKRIDPAGLSRASRARTRRSTRAPAARGRVRSGARSCCSCGSTSDRTACASSKP